MVQQNQGGFKANWEARKAAKEQRKAHDFALAAAKWAEEAEVAMTWAKHGLTNAAGGGAAVVAFRALDTMAKRYYPQDPTAKIDQVLAEIEFDRSRFTSPRFGVIAVTTGGYVEIFRDWVIYGEEAHDVEPNTRATVYTDGSIQMSTAVVKDSSGRDRVVTQQHDLRTAQLTLTSASWSMNVSISPDGVNEARHYIDQLAGHIETLKPRGASAEDIQEMVRTILNSTSQPPAEKIKQLSLLRYDHLLSDQQFEQAKAKILDF